MSSSFQHRTPAPAITWIERWCPPKPLVSLPPIERVLNRHTFRVCPESRLVVAVIARAIGDCLSLTNRRQRREARRFIQGKDLESWCDLVGLHPDFVRFVAQKAGYLAPEDRYWQRLPVREPVLAEPVVATSTSPIHSITCQRTGGLLHA